MAKQIAQLRYYSENNPNNWPLNYSWTAYCTATTFKKNYTSISQIGIQTLPGTKIYLNNGHEPIIIGATGIFELDVSNTTATISSVRIDQESMQTIKDNELGYLIIDLVYGKQEE